MDQLISIVLPVFNGEKYLRESIDSVVSQTYPEWELLILDDCSTDRSAQIAKEYCEKDGRIHYFRNEKNLRLPRNLNRGFYLARGAYLTWTSDDNRFRPTALEKMLLSLMNSGAGFAFASCRIIDENGKEIEYISVNEKSPKLIVGSNTVGACFLYTREVYEAVGEYDPELELVEDYDYWQRILSRFEAVPIPEILYDYRWHDGALTSTMRKDKYHHNLESMLLKNLPLFGKLDIEQKRTLYRTLSRCRTGQRNPYELKRKWYEFLYLIFYRIPNKLARVLKTRSTRKN